MDKTRLKPTRSEGGVDYYVDTLDPHQREFGIPSGEIRKSPRVYSSDTPHIPSRVGFSPSIERSDGCYRTSGAGKD